MKVKAKAYIRLIEHKHFHAKKVPIYVDKQKHHCTNCHMEFEGNYCNNCSQSCNTPRFTYQTVVKNFLGGITNIDSGFFFTIKELFTRPGYMIRDYISGRRVIYFRPLQMLFVLAAVYAILLQIIDPNTLLENHKSIIERNDIITGINGDNLSKWLNNSPLIKAIFSMLERWFRGNIALQMILTTPIIALATKWAFRKNELAKKYNLVELFFVRVYASCQMLVATILLLPFIGSNDGDIPWWLYIISSLWIYAQLFEGKIVSTFKRTLLTYFYSLLIFILIAIIAVILIITLVGISNLKL